MDKLELSNELLVNILGYMSIKKYPYNTRKQYGHTLKRIWDSNDELNRDSIRKILLSFKHQNQRAVLVLINRYCYEEGIDFRIILPKLTRAKRATINILSSEEVELIIRSAPYPYSLTLKCIFRIGAGLRVSEMIKLSWGHFKWVSWVKDKTQLGAVEIKHSKGDPRIVSVPVKLMEEIYGYARHKRVLNEFGIPTGGSLFSFGPDYKPSLRATNLAKWKDLYIRHSYDWFRHNILRLHCEKALGRKLKVHHLRHTRATQLYNDNNIPIEIIQKQLGHADINTTMGYTKIGNRKVFESMKGIN